MKTAPSDYVYEGEGYVFTLLLQAIQAASSPPHALPLSGGLLDQPTQFLEAMRVYQSAYGLYKDYKKGVSDSLAQIGATRGKKHGR